MGVYRCNCCDEDLDGDFIPMAMEGICEPCADDLEEVFGTVELPLEGVEGGVL